jgi:hypothetical protein
MGVEILLGTQTVSSKWSPESSVGLEELKALKAF